MNFKSKPRLCAVDRCNIQATEIVVDARGEEMRFCKLCAFLINNLDRAFSADEKNEFMDAFVAARFGIRLPEKKSAPKPE